MLDFLKETTEEHNRIMEEMHKRQLEQKRLAVVISVLCSSAVTSAIIIEILRRINNKNNR